MELTEQQRQAVKEWLGAGASLSDVQKRLKEEFGLNMTYMDVRLLVLEIGAEVKDKPEPKPPKQAAPPPPPTPEEDDPYADEDAGAGLPEDGGLPEEQEGAGTKVSIALDRIVVPGAMVSGSVTFSDGVGARWLIDQYGRFGLEPDKEGYRPSDADLRAFQMQLRAELQRHGYG